MCQIIFKFCIQVFNYINHQYSQKLFGGLKKVLLAIVRFSNQDLCFHKTQQIVYLFMLQMVQLIQHLLTLLIQKNLHLVLGLHIGIVISMMKSNSNVLLLQ